MPGAGLGEGDRGPKHGRDQQSAHHSGNPIRIRHPCHPFVLDLAAGDRWYDRAAGVLRVRNLSKWRTNLTNPVVFTGASARSVTTTPARRSNWRIFALPRLGL